MCRALLQRNFDTLTLGLGLVFFAAALLYDAAGDHFLLAELVERVLG